MTPVPFDWIGPFRWDLRAALGNGWAIEGAPYLFLDFRGDRAPASNDVAALRLND